VANLIVIIPFFQREQAVLTRTLESIDRQTAFDSITEVVVIDDGSPINAEAELIGLPSRLRDKITIIKQENAGVSAARNTGLVYATSRADYVAFLDSDDIWFSEHISQMLLAFELGADFYFSNFYQPDQSIGAFERANQLDIEQQTKLQETLYQYQQDMTSQILGGNIIGTPTVAFNFSKYPELRFRENLYFAGEDYLFWLDIVQHQPIIIFNTQCNVRCEHGVNIFASATWGSMHLQQRIRDELLFRLQVLKSYQLTNETNQAVLSKILTSRKQFIQHALALLKRGQFQVIPLFTKTLLKDPKILSAIFN